MVLSVVVLLHELRCILPAVLMVSAAPLHLGIWSLIRSLTLVCPSRCYRHLDDKLFATYQRMVVFFFYHAANKQLIFYGDTQVLERSQKKENVIFISNHQSTVDWMVADFVGSFQNTIGRVRFILKDGLKYLPWYGFYFKQHSCVYVGRGGKYNDAKAEKDLYRIKTRKEPIWLVIFPEGTRFNPELDTVIKKSKAFAKSQGLSELKHVLTPRIRAFQASIEQLGDYVDAVYDLTLGYSNNKLQGVREPGPSLIDCLGGASPRIHIHIERIPVATIPRDKAELKKWLHTQFEKKDKLMAHFYSDDGAKSGRFPGEEEMKLIRHRDTLPSALFFTVGLGLILCSQKTRVLYGKWSIVACLGGWAWMSFRS